ncbi:DUF6941 family protein [Nocardioides bruguierae]|uniref:Uncharacterized protein n=1 Tax=Nocardioides bruguierae TaxID=2945102 RepID=A0A9X2D481_9ACTN|nr:hypothetical protein [Nocardioides bruguierae]MCM0618754.1 hypothetical protein [Nocardioides bruguierae]
MASIDYAFVADYAKVESQGTLTVVGASWTFVVADGFPTQRRMAVAGRIRGAMDEGPIPMRVTARGPGRTFEIVAGIDLVAGPDARPYGPERYVGHLFAIDMGIPLLQAGLYEVLVELPNEGLTKRLAFEAQLGGQPAE